MNTCLNCGKPVINKYCNVSCQNTHQGSERANNIYGILTEFNVNCETCKKDFIVYEREFLYPSKNKYFCCRACANKRERSTETKLKISNSLKIHREGICNYCGIKYEKRRKHQQYCSHSCATKNNINLKNSLHLAGLKSVISQNRRSKNEINFYELCLNEYKNVLCNEQIFNGWDADIIIEDFKIAVLWNGVWHYKKISKKHSLVQVENRDKIKFKEIINCGYTPYIIKDMGKENKNFVLKEFEKLKQYLFIDV